jgi:UDP-2,3-diacylglucosamine pyrophosphatase LpxH
MLGGSSDAWNEKKVNKNLDVKRKVTPLQKLQNKETLVNWQLMGHFVHIKV